MLWEGQVRHLSLPDYVFSPGRPITKNCVKSETAINGVNVPKPEISPLSARDALVLFVGMRVERIDNGA